MAHAADGGGGVGTLPRSSLSQTPSPTTAVIPREGGESSTPRCHDSLTGVSGILDRPPARTMTPGTTDMRSPSRGAIRPSFSFRVTPPSKEGCREGRVPDGTRGPLREMHTQEEPHSSIQVKPNTRPSLRDGRTAYAALSREPSSLWPPSPLRKSPARRRLTSMPHSQGLTVATTAGTTRFCRTQAVPLAPRGLRRTSSAVRTTRLAKRLTGFGSIHCPALPPHPRRRCLRPPHPDPRFVTTYDRPLSRDQDERHIR